MWRIALLRAIRFYQSHVSPRKGFRCAYRVLTGRPSCSQLGYRAVRRHGVVGGLALAKRRTARCRVAHGRLRQTRPLRRSEAGFCDGCDLPCDVDGGCLEGACDAADCSSGCGWPRTAKRRDRTEAD